MLWGQPELHTWWEALLAHLIEKKMSEEEIEVMYCWCFRDEYVAWQASAQDLDPVAIILCVVERRGGDAHRVVRGVR
jgi:hypothetical protein